MEVTTISTIEWLLSSRTSYAREPPSASDNLRIFQSYFRWMCIDQSNIRHIMVS
ncbi:hypothetical protein BHE74_00011989 [Ensete ventricosum]|nr:hypothetical protein GW17_00029492 [Ensete ventricosum]RWW79708.1 hypothetical protein BHE74_00011989 [Ensete ventricosum]RZR91879.1 hypothetical protein BHM03_00020070 [Ensete ventricosum]